MEKGEPPASLSCCLQGSRSECAWVLQCLPSADPRIRQGWGISQLLHMWGAIFFFLFLVGRVFPDSSAGKESTCNAGDLGWEVPPGEGKGYPLQYSGLKNSMDYKELDMTEQLSLSLSWWGPHGALGFFSQFLLSLCFKVSLTIWF